MSTTKIKLSAAQWALLQSIKEEPKSIVPYYPPSKKLVEYDYAKWRSRKFGSNVLAITAEGIAALAEYK